MTPIVEVEVNLEAAQKVGIKPGDARRVAAALMQGIVVGNLFEQQKVFEVVVRGAVGVRDDLTSIRELLLDTPTAARSSWARSPMSGSFPAKSVILHDDTSRRIDVVAEVSGRPLADVQRDINAAIEQIQFPLEYHAEIPTKYSEQLAGDGFWFCGSARQPSWPSCSFSRQPCGAGSWRLPSSFPCRPRWPVPPWRRGSPEAPSLCWRSLRLPRCWRSLPQRDAALGPGG